MEDHSGFKRALSFSWAYAFFQNLVGARRGRAWIAENLWRVQPGQKVVDMGCGPGTILSVLPKDISYVGFDISDTYIETAQQKYESRKNILFIKSSVRNLLEQHNQRLEGADIILCNGLLHHLDDAESWEMLRLAKKIMKNDGRLVCVEPAFLIHQSKLSKWIMQKDRGCYIRTESQWKTLIGEVFDVFSTSISVSLIRIPYVHIFIECRKASV